jgi:glutamate--cysteine ligase
MMRATPERTPTRSTAHVSDPTNDAPIRTFDDLLEHFHASMSPRSAWRIGAEMEKPGVYTGPGGSGGGDRAPLGVTGAPVPYAGDRGVLRVLHELATTHGWVPERETEDGPIIALTKNGASITLEPGAQLELSGAPLPNVHDVDAELRAHLAELAPVSRELGVTWLGLGFQPFATRGDLEPMVPKQRYAIMREYLPTRGGHALDMMLRTSTVQANFDYESEADAVKKLRVALKLAPLTTAVLANSPWKERHLAGGVTYRGRVWLDVDPDRSGLVPAMWGEGASFAKYVEWALDAPMFLFKRHGKKVLNTGQTFRSFWKSGFQGEHATQADWQMHLNTLFPEVRLKKTIEIRGADAQHARMAAALPALWTGILYDDRALAEADALTHDWTYPEVQALREETWKQGPRAVFRGKPLTETAQRVIAIAEGGLERRGCKRADGADERVYLAKLKELVGRGRTPADELLGDVPMGPDFEKRVIEAADLMRG